MMRKTKRIFFSLMLGIALTFAILVVFTLPKSASVQAAPGAKGLYVSVDLGVDTGNCTDSQNPCKTIQYAVSEADDGDTIYVANQFSTAVYTSTVTITKPIQLQGGWNVTSSGLSLIWYRPSPCEAFRTVIDAQGAGPAVVFTSSTYQPSIDCFTITGGDNATGKGGGIYGKDVSPIVTNNVITKNRAISSTLVIGYGGGIYLENAGSGAKITGNTIGGNVANFAGIGKGGGIYIKNGQVEIRNNTIVENTASPTGSEGDGGGIYLDEDQGTQVISNTLDGNIGGFNNDGKGGGIFIENPDSTYLAQNEIVNNSATWAGSQGMGGGVFVEQGNITIEQNNILLNAGTGFAGFPSTANGLGGGIAISDTVATVKYNVIEHNIATNGDPPAMGIGAGIYVYTSTLQLVTNYIAYNECAPTGQVAIGGGVYLEETNTFADRNTILSNIAIGTTYDRGGGIRLNNCPAYSIANNVIAKNKANHLGSGMAIIGNGGSLINNTIALNNQGDGVGIYLKNTLASIKNTILVSNTVGITATAGSTANMDATLWGSGSWANGTDKGGAGTITTLHDYYGNPLFIDPG